MCASDVLDNGTMRVRDGVYVNETSDNNLTFCIKYDECKLRNATYPICENYTKVITLRDAETIRAYCSVILFTYNVSDADGTKP